MDPFGGRQNEEEVFEILREQGEQENYGGGEEVDGDEYGYEEFLNEFGDGNEVEQQRNEEENGGPSEETSIDCDDGSENGGPSEVQLISLR